MTATNLALSLEGFTPRHEFLIAIDSDGTAFDTMAIKHRECMRPAMIECFGLEPVAQAARECMDFAGLFSKTRGANRHKTLTRILAELLPAHPMVTSLGFAVPQLPHYFAWVNDPNSTLSGKALGQAIAGAAGSAKKELELVLAWNDGVNLAIERLVKGVPPFPFVRECLRKMQGRADVIVVSTSPCVNLAREWNAQDVARYAAAIAGQETGTKTRCLESAAKTRYNENCVLMIGDAPGDLKAAKANDALFYPIDPGDEEASWKRFHDEAMDKFFGGTYAGGYESELIDTFDSCLPEKPPWA
jgi:phosphoglycolate phosphatase-like HAD superfamily hydrolase